MKKYFNIKFEFNHNKFEQIVKEKSKNGKGYCCFIDLNSLCHTYNDYNLKKILNNATVNSCDGSYIAKLASKLHNKKLHEYIGPDFFRKFIFNEGTHLILGNTKKVYNKIVERVLLEGGSSKNIKHISLPFKSVDDFDYKLISRKVNKINPNYIWVSLGAPKQEYFMSNLLPFLNSGIMIGVGAALNYFSGNLKDIPFWIKKLNIIWIYRAFQEPKKQLPRIINELVIFPKMILEERNNLKK